MKKEIILPHNHHDSQSHEAILASMPSGESIAVVADALRHLGDPSRLKIFWLLCHTEECVADIAEYSGMSSPAVSHHLRLLKTAGLIVSLLLCRNQFAAHGMGCIHQFLQMFQVFLFIAAKLS